MTSPSTTGCHGIVLATTSSLQRSGSGSAIRSAFSCACAVSSWSTGTAAIASRVGGTRSRAARSRPIRRAVAGRNHVVRRAALRDRPPEQALGARHGQQRGDAHRAGRLTEDRHVDGTPAEGGDVVPHPLQGRHQVEQAEVGDPVPQVQEAVRPHPPVDDTHTTPSRAKAVPSYDACEPTSNIPPWIQTMTGSPAAPGSGVHTLRFRHSPAVTGAKPPFPGDTPEEARDRSGRVPDTTPPVDRLRWTEAVRAERRRRVGHAEERAHTIA